MGKIHCHVAKLCLKSDFQGLELTVGIHVSKQCIADLRNDHKMFKTFLFPDDQS